MTIASRSLLRSETTRELVQEALSHTLKMEVRVERLSPTLFRGTALKGLAARNAAGASFSADEIFIHPRLLPLLRGELVLEELRVSSPRIVWVESAPATPPPAAPENAAPGSPAKSPRKKAFIQAISIENAALDWTDSSGHARIQAEGGHARITFQNPETASGNLGIATCKLFESIPLTNLNAQIQLRDGRIHAENLRAQCGGGTFSGRISVATHDRQLPLEADLSAERINLGIASQDLRGAPLEGTAQGALKLEGPLKQRDALKGAGHLFIENGSFRGITLLQTIGQVLQIRELATLRMRTASARFEISNEAVHLSEFDLVGDTVTFSAPGKISFNKQLQLNARIALPEKMLGGKALALIGNRLSEPDADGRRALSFEITGPLSKPGTNLVSKLVGDNLGGVLEQAIGGLLKRKPAKSETQETAGETSR